MNNKVKNVKKQKEAEPPLNPVQKPNIFEFAKKRIEKDSKKLDKLIMKLEKSIANHDKEKADKELALKECRDELKQLSELVKQT
jgi:small-conductance mechanosensitive channel